MTIFLERPVPKSRSRRIPFLAAFCVAALALLTQNVDARGQDAPGASADVDASGATWREPDPESGAFANVPSAAATSASATPASTGSSGSGSFTGPKTTRFSYELSNLPNSDGQFWVVYDIAPYTERFPNLANPQNSIVDWILFDSGDDFWRKEPFSVLSATRERLYVYHATNVQNYVANVVDRFIDPAKRGVSFTIKLVALQSPDWRARVTQYLTPLSTTIVGNGADVQSWSTDRAGMAKVAAEISRRTDYLLLNAVKNVVPNGETFGWAAASPRKEFSRDYRVDPTSTAGYSSDVTAVDEGFRIETTPLLSTTGEALETTFRYRSTVVEKTKSFSLRVPTATAPRQQLSVEKPMIVSCDFRGKITLERSKCAIIDLGMTPLSPPNKGVESSGIVESVTNFVAPKSVFYDVLIMIEETE